MEDLERFLNKSDYKLIGLLGGAGSGKSTLADNLAILTYNADYSFIGDSNFRRKLLETKEQKSLESYIDSCNMYNWWNWDSLERIVNDLKISGNRVIVEGAILGPESILNKFDIILFLYVRPEERFHRLLERDKYKRSFTETINRFLITEYSESLYYSNILIKFNNKIITLDKNYSFINFDPKWFDGQQYIPLRTRK